VFMYLGMCVYVSRYLCTYVCVYVSRYVSVSTYVCLSI
jgi:hypothetical protein